jgi:hypothetical protein
MFIRTVILNHRRVGSVKQEEGGKDTSESREEQIK